MQELKTNRIVRLSLREQAAEKIRSWILSLQLQPGERLVVDNLAEELAISRTPIREGLHKLVAEGLVVYDGKSYVVTKLSRRDIENLFEVRCALEVLAARQATECMSHELLETLWKWHEEFKEHQHENDIEFFLGHDRRFHQMICEGSGNDRLKALLENLNEQLWWIIRLIYVSKAAAFNKPILLQEHLAILQCITARDPEGAATMMRTHVYRAEARYLEQYVEQ